MLSFVIVTFTQCLMNKILWIIKKKKLIKLLIIIINLNLLINKNIYNLCPMGSLYFVGFVGFKYILNFDTKKKNIKFKL